MLLCCITFIPIFPTYGHLYGLNYQDWKDSRYNIHMQFDTIPPTPTTNNSTTMLFSVQDLKTGEHVKNFKETITIVTPSTNPTSNGLVHKFETKVINGTDFSESYKFPSGGTYFVLLRVDTLNTISIAKFTVFVSSPQFQLFNMGLILFPVIIVVAIFAVILLVTVHYIYKKK